jgi:hypothetical protein
MRHSFAARWLTLELLLLCFNLSHDIYNHLPLNFNITFLALQSQYPTAVDPCLI